MLLFLSGAAPQRSVARHSGENRAVLLVLQFASHFWKLCFAVVATFLCSWRPLVLGKAGTGVTRGCQQPGLRSGRKTGLCTGCSQTFSLALPAVTDRFATSLRADLDRKQKQILFGGHIQA